MQLKDRIAELLQALNKDIFEKEDIIALSFLSTIAGESIFLLGKPGVAKSLIARRLKYAFAGGNSFEYLMNKFSTPDEIFGPVSIKKLKDEDKYERLVDNYLPTANIVFLDEIWKAGPSIQNALLTIINEKVYRNGDQEIKAAIIGLIAASNELPEKGQGLDALWDRFLIRQMVTGIQEKENFNRMISEDLNLLEDAIAPKLKVTQKEYQAWSKAIPKIDLSPAIFQIVHVIRAKLQAYNGKQEEDQQIYISDRRWRKIVRILRTSALLNGREMVDLMDCFLIAHCIWNEPDQVAAMKELVATALKEHGYALSVPIRPIRQQIEAFSREVKNDTKVQKDILEEENYEVSSGYYEVEGLKHYGSYNRIKIVDYKRINQATILVPLYNTRYQKISKYCKLEGDTLKIRKDMYAFNWETCKIRTHLVAKPTLRTMKPNSRLQAAWDEHTAELKQMIGELITQVDTYRKEHLAQLHTNLFVDSRLATIVEANLHSTIQQLQQLLIEVENIKHYYATLK